MKDIKRSYGTKHSVGFSSTQIISQYKSEDEFVKGQLEDKKGGQVEFFPEADRESVLRGIYKEAVEKAGPKKEAKPQEPPKK